VQRFQRYAVLIFHREILDEPCVTERHLQTARTPQKHAAGGRVLLRAVVCAWLIAVVGGSAALTAYAGRSGAGAAGPDDWPAATTLQRDPQRATLVTFLHPRCPCSRATLANLARLEARCAEKLCVQLVFVVPNGKHDAWAHAALWDAAGELGFESRWMDRGGRSARLFGAETSGQTYVFGPDGKLRFAGGLTPGRGHEGDCDGTLAILACVEDARLSVQRAAVFGCGLHDACDEPTESCRDPGGKE
jgi:hypothetical protein